MVRPDSLQQKSGLALRQDLTLERVRLLRATVQRSKLSGKKSGNLKLLLM